MEKIKVSNIEAINNALNVAMEHDSKIVIYGEDVGFEGGVFRTTKGLQAKYGIERVWDSPIAEASIVGTAIGAAVAGLHPVVELQFQGFSYPALQHIIVHAARIRNRSRGVFSVPLVIRMPMGGGVRALEHHSEATEAIFSHIPGIKVVMPSNPYDSKGMLIAAIEDPDTVIFLEPKKIYRAFKQEIPAERYTVELGKAAVLVPGDTITVVTYGTQVHDTLKVIPELQKEGINIELIDLRTIKPIDTDTIIKSVKKTKRLLVIHEAVKSFSISSEIISRVNEKAFLDLVAPPSRLTGWDITIPYAKGEKYHMITPAKIADKIKEVCSFTF